MTDSTESPIGTAVEAIDVPLKELVPHPANPRRDLGDLDELAASITSQGVLEPIVVIPADRAAWAWPDHAQALAGAVWVTLLGHRRVAAAQLAGRDSVPAVIRRDAIADEASVQLEAMTAENVARASLAPLDEALAFQALMAAGKSQRKVAAVCGCSQSHVSKRLKLLGLPDEIQAKVRSGKLTLADAQVLLELPDQEQMRGAWRAFRDTKWTSMERAVTDQRALAVQVARRAESEKQAAAEGIELVEPGRLGNRYWEHRLYDKKAIANARKAGTLVADANYHGGLDYYSTTKPGRGNRSAEDQARLDEERERRHAYKARRVAAAQLAARPPKLPEVAAAIVDAYLDRPGNDAACLAKSWLAEAGRGPDPAIKSWDWWPQLRELAWPVRVHAAHALALAQAEISASLAYRSSWDARVGAYLGRLVAEVDYIPTDWEQGRLDAIPTAAEPVDCRLAYSVVDGWEVHTGEELLGGNDGIEHDAVADAQAWASQLLSAERGLQSIDWRARLDQDGHTEYVTTG